METLVAIIIAFGPLIIFGLLGLAWFWEYN